MLNKDCVKYGSAGSAIRELYEYGKKRAKEIGKENVYDFSLGNPSISSPKEVKDAIKELLDDQSVHAYTSNVGYSVTRKAIAKHLNEKYEANASSDRIYLTCGAAAGLTITLKAITSYPSDEVIVFAPYFPEYSLFIENAGATKVVCNSDANMLIDFEDLESKITKHTRAVLIDSPNNPTGVVYSEEVIVRLANLLRKKQEEFDSVIYLISDEPYRELIYSNKKYPFITRYYDNSIVIYSFSKSLSLPGERIGYILVGSNCKDSEDVYHAIKGSGRLLGFVNAPSLFQHVLPKVLECTSDLSTYARNRDELYKILTELGYEVIYPEGAFYMFVKALEDDASRFSNRALQYELLLVPSDSFGVKGYVRLAYCVELETILKSEEAFRKLKESYEVK